MVNPATGDGTDAPYEEREVEIALDEIIDNDGEVFLDLLSERGWQSSLLVDITYRIIGHDDHSLKILVSGDVSEIREADDA